MVSERPWEKLYDCFSQKHKIGFKWLHDDLGSTIV